MQIAEANFHIWDSDVHKLQKENLHMGHDVDSALCKLRKKISVWDMMPTVLCTNYTRKFSLWERRKISIWDTMLTVLCANCRRKSSLWDSDMYKLQEENGHVAHEVNSAVCKLLKEHFHTGKYCVQNAEGEKNAEGKKNLGEDGETAIPFTVHGT